MPDVTEIKQRLEAQLVELTERQRRIAGPLTTPLDADSSERAVEIEDDAALAAQNALIEREILSVDRALERIAEGRYGQCVRCGDAIAPARLEARPEAALCIACAAAEEDARA